MANDGGIAQPDCIHHHVCELDRHFWALIEEECHKAAALWTLQCGRIQRHLENLICQLLALRRAQIEEVKALAHAVQPLDVGHAALAGFPHQQRCLHVRCTFRAMMQRGGTATASPILSRRLEFQMVATRCNCQRKWGGNDGALWTYMGCATQCLGMCTCAVQICTRNRDHQRRSRSMARTICVQTCSWSGACMRK